MLTKLRGGEYTPDGMALRPALAVEEDRGSKPPDRLIGFALVATAVRCVLRYVVLPFGLPLLGLAPGLAQGIVLACDAAAVGFAVTGVWRLWAVRHPLRWRYALLAGGALLLVGVLRARDVIA